MKIKKINTDLILSICAIFISLSALVVAITETRLMKEQTKAVLYPHLDMGYYYNSKGFEIRVKNSGSGIALVKSVKLNYKETEFENWSEICDYFLPEGHAVGYNIYSTNSINKKAILPGEELLFFAVPWNSETEILVDALGELSFSVQYASILNDFWEINEETDFPLPISFKETKGIQFR